MWLQHTFRKGESGCLYKFEMMNRGLIDAFLGLFFHFWLSHPLWWGFTTILPMWLNILLCYGWTFLKYRLYLHLPNSSLFLCISHIIFSLSLLSTYPYYILRKINKCFQNTTYSKSSCLGSTDARAAWPIRSLGGKQVGDYFKKCFEERKALSESTALLSRGTDGWTIRYVEVASHDIACASAPNAYLNFKWL